jgi:peptidoglycan/LPS O-acetylase OafA/YrhL
VLACVAAGEAAETGRLRDVTVVLALLAGFLLALGLAGSSPSLVGWALLALGAGYAVALVDRSAADAWAAAYAAAYLLIGELGFAALEERRLDRGRIAVALGLALAGAAVGAVVLVVGQASVGGGLAVEALGVVAAVAALALVAALSRRLRGG